VLQLLKAFALLYVRPLEAIRLILDYGSVWSAGALAAAVMVGARAPFAVLLLLALAYVPAAAVIAAKLEARVSAGIALERDFTPALVCHLMAWSAAMILLIALDAVLPPPADLPVAIAAAVYFLVLSVLSLRAVSGASAVRASLAAACAVAVAAAAAWAYTLLGSLAYFLASPWVLYYLYLRFGSEVQTLGGGLSSRQRMRQLLETATVNPRDADAHYQLGLIYQQRRDVVRARACFEKAVAIDPTGPDAQYQLGCLLRAAGEPARALELLEEAAAIDDKFSSSEVWREIGAASLDLQQNEHARDVLRVYVQRRPFDAEGLYWYGIALARLGDRAQAREQFKAAVEAVRTSPSHRRRQIARWGRLAAKELRRLAASAV